MRIIKDPFTGELLLSLDSFESKQVKDKGYVKISTKTNFFGYLKILHDDLSEHAKIRNKSKTNTSNS